MSTRQEEAALVDTLGLYQKAKLGMHSKTREHWRVWGNDVFYVERMSEEIDELITAMAGGASPDEVWREAADIANFAAMVADRYEQRRVYAKARG